MKAALFDEEAIWIMLCFRKRLIKNSLEDLNVIKKKESGKR